MNQLDSALHLAKKGFYVFPLHKNSKVPVIDDYTSKATRDEKQIREWFSQPYNIGISTSKFQGNKHLVAVDVDNKNGQNGNETLAKFELLGFDLPETFEQITPTTGRHLVYLADSEYKNSVKKIGEGLDIRAKGGYIVGAGSILNNKAYSLLDRDLAPVPLWLINKLNAAVVSDEPAVELSKVNAALAKERATHYLEKEAPLAVESRGGDQTTFLVAARVKDFGVKPNVAVALMETLWNPRCDPPWDTSELETKVRNAYKYGERPPGAAAPESEFEPIPQVEPVKKEEPQELYLDVINKEFAFVVYDGGHSIMQHTVDAENKPIVREIPESTFKAMFAHTNVQIGKSDYTYAEAWLEWEKRKQYSGVCFLPGKSPKNNYYNTWKGFVCEPIPYADATPIQQQGFDLFVNHAKENVCDNNEALYGWLMDWFAHLVQRPWERPLTTLVFKGEKGVGKNSLIDIVGDLMSPKQYLVTQDDRFLTSNFNAHLEECLLCVFDEAFWSGNKKAEGKLKGLTTEKTMLVERKGREAYRANSYVRIVIIGNDDWIVPASYDERRYAVFQVGLKRRQDSVYFSQLKKLMSSGSNQVLMHFLMNRDLSKFDIATAPKTKALLEQKQESLGSFEGWIFECLKSGKLLAGRDDAEPWSTEVTKVRFRNAFMDYAKYFNQTRKFMDKDSQLGRKLKAIFPTVNLQKQKRNGPERIYVYEVPPLKEARELWDVRMGIKGEWNDETNED